MKKNWEFYYTSNGTVEPKGFDKCLIVPSTKIITNEKGKEVYVDKYKTYFDYLLDTSLTYNLHQVSTGLNHGIRNCFVMDCDNNATPELLDGILSIYFVRPTFIMRNASSGHCQVFWVFNKPIHTHSLQYGSNKLGQRYIELTHKLNSFLHLGDDHFTGWWCKNPLSFELYNYSSFNSYDYEFLEEQIEMLDQKLTWEEVPTVMTLKREMQVENDNNELGVTIPTTKEITLFVPTFEPTATEHNDSGTDSDTTKVVKEPIVKKEKKVAKTVVSENRHNTLYKFMVCYSKQHNNVINYNELKEYVYFYNSILFKEPLTVSEIEKTLLTKKTLDGLRHILDYAAYQKHRSKVVTDNYYQLCMEHNVNLSDKKAITKCLKENTTLQKGGISKQVKKIMLKYLEQ